MNEASKKTKTRKKILTKNIHQNKTEKNRIKQWSALFPLLAKQDKQKQNHQQTDEDGEHATEQKPKILSPFARSFCFPPNSAPEFWAKLNGMDHLDNLVKRKSKN